MMDQQHTIHTDDIDDWIDTLRSGGFWGHQMDTVARAILETMAHSEHPYTGTALSQVIRSPLRRRKFITHERDTRTRRDTRRLRQLIAADDSTYSLLAKRVERG
jgi:hypothetical protein